MQHVSPVEDFPTEKWDAIIALNLTATFHTTKHAVPAMKEAGWGRIINIASLQSIRAFPNGLAYGASKGGISNLPISPIKATKKPMG
jgi:3-hydroxybutyrate dehydrogenase